MLVIQYSHKQRTRFRENIFMKQKTAEYCSNMTNMFVMRCFKEIIHRFFTKTSAEFYQILQMFLVTKYIKILKKQRSSDKYIAKIF